ncbi:MAG TPA: sulfotransferase [Caulobacteraceae bacterium]
MDAIFDPSLSLDEIVHAIAARVLDRPIDSGVRHSLRAACRAPAVSREAAVRCADGLLVAEMFDEAEALYAALARYRPKEAGGFVGLAQLAMHRGDWPRALVGWDEVLTRFGDRPNADFWRSRRATALMRLGRGVEAEAAMHEVLAAFPRHPSAFLVLLRRLSDTGRLDEARREFQRALNDMDEPAIAATLFDVTPALYEGAARTGAWVSLLGKLGPILETEDGPGAEAAEVLRLRLHLALRDNESFLAAVAALGNERRLGSRDRMVRNVATALRDPAYPDFSKPKVFGIGLSKTGTTTLASALTKLGLNTVDWTNPLTRELMCDDDLHKFDAFTDTPASVSFEKYFHMFPNARFIYTTRPPEDWLDSIVRHWRRDYGLADFKDIKSAMRRPDQFHYGLALRNILQSLYLNFADFPEAFRAHDERVRRFFSDKPKARFLEFDIFAGHGWPELCGFLGAAIPDQPFPWANRNPAPGGAGAESAAGRGSQQAKRRQGGTSVDPRRVSGKNRQSS